MSKPSLRVTDSVEDREEEAREVYGRIDDFKTNSGFDTHCNNLKKWDLQWRGRIPRTNKPWDHASEYNPLLTLSKVEDVHALLFSFYSSFEWYAVASADTKPGVTEDIIKKKAEQLTELLRWSQSMETNGVAFLDRFLHDGVLYGSAFGQLDWLRHVRNIQTEIFIPSELRGSKLDDKGLIKAALRETLISKQIKEGPDGSWGAKFVDEDGIEKDAFFWVLEGGPYHAEEEKSLICRRNSVTYNAPVSKNKSISDMLIPADIVSLQAAKRYHTREYLTYDDIADLHKKGIFNALSGDELKELKEIADKKYQTVSATNSQDSLDSQRDSDFSMKKLQTRSLDKFEVYFEWAYEDLDGDGSAESIVRAVIDTPRRMLCMRHRLEYLYGHGRRPHFDWQYIPVDGRYYGIGIPELLELTQSEENAFYQSRSDVLEIITKPGGMYSTMSGLAPSEIKYVPGMMIKVRDVRSAYAPFTFSVDPGLLFREQQGVEVQAERAIGSTDMGLGRGPTRPNAPRTASGTKIMVRQQQMRSDVYLKRSMFGCSADHSSGVCEWLIQYLSNYQLYMDDNKAFRALGTNEPMIVSRGDIQGRYDFVIDFGPQINNPQIREASAEKRYVHGLQNPLIANNPLVLRELTVNFFEATGLKSARKLIPLPQQAEEHLPYDQEDEFVMLSKGQYIKPLQIDNHVEHLTSIAAIMQDPIQLASKFSPSALMLLERHAQEHVQMMMAAGQGQLQAPSNGQVPGGNGQQSLAGASAGISGGEEDVEF